MTPRLFLTSVSRCVKAATVKLHNSFNHFQTQPVNCPGLCRVHPLTVARELYQNYTENYGLFIKLHCTPFLLIGKVMTKHNISES